MAQKSGRGEQSSVPTRGKRFRILFYERMWKRWALSCALIVILSLIAWGIAPLFAEEYGLYRALLLLPAAIALAIFLLALLSRRRAWVECRRDYLRVQTPFFGLNVAYSRIKEIKPTSFGELFQGEKRPHWNAMRPYWNQTALVVTLSKYPVNEKWLRFWFSPYLLYPGPAGLVFVVADWMALARQIEDFRTHWGRRRAQRRPK